MYLDFLSSIKAKSISGTTICGVNICSSGSATISNNIIFKTGATRCIAFNSPSSVGNGTTLIISGNSSGNLIDTNGGTVSIIGGNSCGENGIGGDIFLTGGINTGVAGGGGRIYICGGCDNSSTDGSGGAVIICAGKSTNMSGGNVLIYTGCGPDSDGGILFYVGNSGMRASITGLELYSVGCVRSAVCLTAPLVCGTTCVKSPIICGTSCVRSPLISGTSVILGGIAYSAYYASGVSASGPINASFLKANHYGSNQTSLHLNWDAADNYGIGSNVSNIVKLEGAYSTAAGRTFNGNPVDFRVTGSVSGSTCIASPIVCGGTCMASPKFVENGTCLVSTYLPFTMTTDQQDPTGFVNGPNIDVSYSHLNRTITLTGTLDYYWKGVKKTLTSPWTSAAHTNTSGVWFLYSTDGTNILWSNTVWSFTDLMISLVNYKSASSGTTFAIRETHGMMPWSAHQDFHKNIGTYLYSGGAATSWTASTATNAANSPNFNAAVIADEDNITNISGITKGAYTLMRVSGATSIYTLASTTPFSGATNDFIRVNDPITGGWTAGINARYYNVYQILIPTTSDVTSQKFRTIFLQPQATYATLATAQAEDSRGLYLGSLATESNEFIPYARITYFTANANNNYGKVTIPTGGITYIVGNRMGSTSMSGVVSPTNHANLTNLSWANSGHVGNNNALAGFDSSGNACSNTNMTFDGTSLCLNAANGYIMFTPNSAKAICFNADSSANGQSLWIEGNRGASTSNGGNLIVRAGYGGGTSGNGGCLCLQGGDVISGTAGCVMLVHGNNSTKLKTTTTGVQVCGDISFPTGTRTISVDGSGTSAFNIKAQCGGSQGGCLYMCAGSGSTVAGGVVYLCGGCSNSGTGGDIQIFPGASVSGTEGSFRVRSINCSSILAKPSGAVCLYYNGNGKFETTSTGICVTGIVDASTCITTPIFCASTCVAVGPTRTVCVRDGGVTMKGETGGWAMEYGYIGSTGTARGGFGMLGSGNDNTWYYIGCYGSEKMVLTEGGYVGIGTTTPIAKLELSAAGTGYWNNATDWTNQSPPFSTMVISNKSNGGYDSALLFRQTDSAAATKNAGAIGLVGTGAWISGSNATQTSDMYIAVRSDAGGICERMRIKSNGNVGIGINSPTQRLHVAHGHTDTMIRLQAVNGGAGYDANMTLWASEPTKTYTGVGLSNNWFFCEASNVWARYDTTIGGSYIAMRDNEINFYGVTSAGVDNNRMTICNSGSVCAYTCLNSPAVCVSSALYVGANITLSAGGDFNLRDGGTPDSTAVRFFSAAGNLYLQNGSGDNIYFRSKLGATTGCIGNTGILYVAVCGCSTDWVATSDCRLKTDIKPISNALSTVMNLQGVCYHMCDDETCEMHLGLIAQDVQKVLPEVVSHGTPNEVDAKYGITDEKLGLKYDKLSAVLIEAIKEQQLQIKEQQKQLDSLCLELNYMRNSNT